MAQHPSVGITGRACPRPRASRRDNHRRRQGEGQQLRERGRRDGRTDRRCRQSLRLGNTCFFCGRSVRKGKNTSKHHIMPKRYGRETILHLACNTCHQRWHREIDNPQLDFIYYAVVMILVNWGRGIYSPALFLWMSVRISHLLTTIHNRCISKMYIQKYIECLGSER